MEAPKSFVNSRLKLVESIKKQEPTLKELFVILKKNGFESQNEMDSFIYGWNVMQYVKKDKFFMKIMKKLQTLNSQNNKKKFMSKIYKKLSKKTNNKTNNKTNKKTKNNKSH
jgi:hypothetical protein